MSEVNAKTRFSNRVADYIRYRPSYPDAIPQMLCAEAGLNPASVVADIGSGTGISAELFLKLGCSVFGVEPNPEMRVAAERRYAMEPRFRSIDGTAETTTLASQSVDHVAAGQAFHWFDVEKSRTEFNRILRLHGMVSLFWNTRRTDSTPFLAAYENLLIQFSTDYELVNHTRIDVSLLKRFFGHARFKTRTFPNSQFFDHEGLRGRLLSSSYAPAAGHPLHEPMLLELERLFHIHQIDDRVAFDYDTELYFGPLSMR